MYGLLEDIAADLTREAVGMAARAMRDTVQDMPPEAARAFNAAALALTPEIAARKARCSRRTINRAITDREIRAMKGSTGLWILDRDSFDAWRAARMPVLPTLPDRNDFPSDHAGAS